MDLSIIIISYNTKDILVECLQSILKQSDNISKEIIIVDNGSTDGTPELISDHFSKVRLIKNTDNVGYAKANNQAANTAQGTYLFFLNSDTIVNTGAISELVKEVKTKEPDLATCQLINPDKSIQPQGGKLPGLCNIFFWMTFIDDLPLLNLIIPRYQQRNLNYFTSDHSMGWISGTAMLFNKEKFRLLGGFDEKLFMYSEDVELCLRAHQQKLRVKYFSSPQITHVGQASGSSASAIFGEYNGLKYIFKKHKPSWQLPILRLWLKIGALLRISIFGIMQDNAKKPSTKKLLNWLDENILALLAGFLIVFIPLFPKIPIADVIPGYIVRVRLEDFFILFTLIVWFIQLLRKKARWHPLLTKLIILYLIIGLISALSAIFLINTVPANSAHVSKLFFHWFRRIEYFALFFIFYSALKTKTQAKTIILLLIPVTLIISIYGFGQKYLYWPVYSTMNREFSKGVKLYLTEHARVPSTFGGHYDAAAWVMAVITIILAIALLTKNIWLKIISFIAFIAGFWLLILTASRTSFIAYLFSISMLMFILIFIKSIKWSVPRWMLIMTFSMVVMLSFGDLSERYREVLGLDKLRSNYYEILFKPKVDRPKNIKEIDLVTTPSDQTPVAEKPDLPGGVYEDIPDVITVASSSGLLEKRLVSRTYSDNAYKYGLSAAIRFDALWPRAWEGFKRNPLFGSGYSTLTKEEVGIFTEAESTDNDFLRSLGETGLLGFITFYGAIIAAAYLSLKYVKKYQDPILMAFAIGFAAATFGLLLNAVYIDIFEASKVAELFWALAGIALILPLIEDLPAKPVTQDKDKAASKKEVKKSKKNASKKKSFKKSTKAKK